MLRLVQLYLGYNLLGQSNSAARTSMTELYLVWCAKHGRKLHLGFWTAYQCHLIATYPASNLSLCHILGAFVRNNIIITEAEDLSSMYMVDWPVRYTFLRPHKRGILPRRSPSVLPDGRSPWWKGTTGPRGASWAKRTSAKAEAVTELAEENRQSRAEMTRLTILMENVLKELARGKKSTGAGTSGHGGQNDEPTEPEEEKGDEQEEAEDNQPESTEEEPKKPPDPCAKEEQEERLIDPPPKLTS